MAEEPEQLESINDQLLTEENQDSNAKSTIISEIHWFPFFLGIIMFILGFVCMIAFYVIPYNNIKANKNKYPDATFIKPKTIIIVMHFLLHSSLMLFGISVVLIGLNNFMSSFKFWIKIIVAALSCLFFSSWLAQIFIAINSTQDPDPLKTIEQVHSYLVNPHPTDFAFIYSSDMLIIPSCVLNPKTGTYDCQDKNLRCYSITGVTVPLKSNLVSEPYDFKKSPDVFNFNIEQVINMSNQFSLFYNDIMDHINKCEGTKKVVEYHPIISGTYMVAINYLPKGISHSTRLVSAIFGAGVYYELNSKSIPYINYKQFINVDIDPNCNYNNIWTNESCTYYGKCNIYNQKPSPQINHADY